MSVHTENIEPDRVVQLSAGLGRHLAVVPALVLWPHCLDDQAPLPVTLVEVQTDAGVRGEREEADSERVDLAFLSPGDLHPEK